MPVYGYCQAPQPMIACDIVSSTTFELESKDKLFSLYPNPAIDEVIVNIDNPGYKDMQLNIYNVTGGLVWSFVSNQDQLKINVEDLNSGIYFVVLKSDDLIESQRLVIQR